MINFLNYLDGKKTYIMSFCAFVTGALYISGKITPDMANFLVITFSSGAMMALRSAVGKTPPTE